MRILAQQQASSNINFRLEFDLENPAEVALRDALAGLNLDESGNALDFKMLEQKNKRSFLARLFRQKARVTPSPNIFILRGNKARLINFLQQHYNEPAIDKALLDQLAEVAQIDRKYLFSNNNAWDGSFVEEEEINMTQDRFIKGAIRYFEKKLAVAKNDQEKKDLAEPLEYFKKSQGECRGLSLLWSYCHLVEDLKRQQNLSGEVDDSIFFRTNLRRFCEFDAKEDLAPQQESEMERFLSHIIFFQTKQKELLAPEVEFSGDAMDILKRILSLSDEEESGIRMKLNSNLEDTQGRKFYESAARFSCSRTILERVVEDSLSADRMVFFVARGVKFGEKPFRHIISLFKHDDGRIFYYNSNDKDEQPFSNLSDLTDVLWKALQRISNEEVNAFGKIKFRPNHFVLLNVEMYDIALTERQIGLKTVSSEEFSDLLEQCNTADDDALRSIFALLTIEQMKEIAGSFSEAANGKKILIDLVSQKKFQNWSQLKEAAQLVRSNLDAFTGEERKRIEKNLLQKDREIFRRDILYCKSAEELLEKLRENNDKLKYSEEEARDVVGKYVVENKAIKKISGSEVKEIMVDYLLQHADAVPASWNYMEFLAQNLHAGAEGPQFKTFMQLSEKSAAVTKDKFLSDLQTCRDFSSLDLKTAAAVAPLLSGSQILQFFATMDKGFGDESLASTEDAIHEFLLAARCRNQFIKIDGEEDSKQIDELFMRMIQGVKNGFYTSNRGYYETGHGIKGFIENLLSVCDNFNIAPSATALFQMVIKDEKMGEFLAKRYYGEADASKILAKVAEAKSQPSYQKTQAFVKAILDDEEFKKMKPQQPSPSIDQNREIVKAFGVALHAGR